MLLIAGCATAPEFDDDTRTFEFGDADTDTDADTDSDTSTECRVTAITSVPTQGSMDAYYRGNIEFELNIPDATAHIATEIVGHEETGEDFQSYVWVLDEPLLPDTAYSATLDHCAGEATIEFTTSHLGADLAADVTGLTWVLNLEDARIVEPRGIGDVLTSYLTEPLLLGVASIGDDAMDMLLTFGTGDPPDQDECNETASVTGDLSERPYFETTTSDLTMEIADSVVVAEDAQITGAFAEDGSWIGGATLTGSIDTRPLDILLDDSGETGAICQLAESFGSECTACASDDEPYCLWLSVDRITGDVVDGLTLVEIEEACE